MRMTLTEGETPFRSLTVGKVFGQCLVERPKCTPISIHLGTVPKCILFVDGGVLAHLFGLGGFFCGGGFVG